MARQDLDSTRSDLVINALTGDFQIGDSDQAHIEHILDAHKGDFKEFPLLGIASVNFLTGPGGDQSVKREIINGLKADNYGSIVVNFNENSLTIDAEPLT
tara:strand:+ start:29 stop:328 length:300 start_codon:yes stop_codon:yes gene_type:complete